MSFLFSYSDNFDRRTTEFLFLVRGYVTWVLITLGIQSSDKNNIREG